MLNSGIRYIDTCAGYNGRGTFSNELLDFVQDLSSVSLQEESLAALKTAVLSSVIRQQYKNGLIDEFMSTTVNEKVSMTFKSTPVKPEIITTIENGE